MKLLKINVCNVLRKCKVTYIVTKHLSDKKPHESVLVNDRTTKNRVRPNPEASAISTEASAEASAESLPINSVKNVRFLFSFRCSDYFFFSQSKGTNYLIVFQFQLGIIGC